MRNGAILSGVYAARIDAVEALLAQKSFERSAPIEKVGPLCQAVGLVPFGRQHSAAMRPSICFGAAMRHYLTSVCHHQAAVR